MILPISHEKMTARRWPIVTTIVVLLGVVCQGLLARAGDAAAQQAQRAERAVESFYFNHPYLELRGEPMHGEAESLQLARGMLAPVDPPDDDTRQAEQSELDDLVAALGEAKAADPYRHFGYVPAEHNWLGLLTSTFVHNGWLHLVGNMWFLVLCAMNLEDRWGRVAFPLFYAAAGAVAALAHGLVTRDPTLPLVGASGAVAGAMGAFAVLFAKTRVRFVAWLGWRLIFFSAPAYVMLGLWVAVEALWGFVWPSDGTAHWAHVGGFAFGVAVALLLRRTGADRKLDDAVERVATLGGDPRLEGARVLVSRGRAREALALLEGLATEKPGSVHVHEAIADVARKLGDAPREQKARAAVASLRANLG
jgi:membrane associated rhomboid family serine protease